MNRIDNLYPMSKSQLIFNFKILEAFKGYPSIDDTVTVHISGEYSSASRGFDTWKEGETYIIFANIDGMLLITDGCRTVPANSSFYDIEQIKALAQNNHTPLKQSAFEWNDESFITDTNDRPTLLIRQQNWLIETLQKKLYDTTWLMRIAGVFFLGSVGFNIFLLIRRR